MKFFDNSDITDATFTIEVLIRTHGLFYNQYTVTKQIYLQQELHIYLFQHFIMKMQTVLFKNILHTEIKKIEREDAISELGRVHLHTKPKNNIYNKQQ